MPVISTLLTLCSLLFQDAVRAPRHAEKPARLLIRNAMVVKGNGNPPAGPTNVLVEKGVIADIGASAGEGDKKPDAVIDGTGKWVLPGFVCTHTHLHDERAGIPIEHDYQLRLWLSCGITTIRETGSVLTKHVPLRRQSREGELIAPRMFLYTIPPGARTPEEAREKVRAAKTGGADGLKLFGMDRDLLEAVMDEAHKQGLRTTVHIGIEEVTAWDFADLGVTSIEHWYGIPNAALRGVQKFPPDFNAANETDRFRWAGRLWRETDPERVDEVLRFLVDKRVAWSPTLSIYEANRDLRAAQNRPWFKDYLHPALEEYFKPNLQNHGSYFIGWTNTDEVYWKENYRIWMGAVKRFADLGGLVTTGEDAGYIWSMYGFGYLRELELHEEAGFHPLEVIQHATVNGARVLGEEARLGRVRAGYAADLLVVNGNPVANLRVLYPTGTDFYVDGRSVAGGGIEWTIKDGHCYHVPTLMGEVRGIVAKARGKRAGAASKESGK